MSRAIVPCKRNEFRRGRAFDREAERRLAISVLITLLRHQDGDDMRFRKATGVGLALFTLTVHAQHTPSSTPPEWSAQQKPFQVYGNTYYVGTRGLTSLLITSHQGHVLIDGALPYSASQIAANIRTLGFRVEDVKLILNSHAHFDHAGGIARLQSLSQATVAASALSAPVLQRGEPGPDDPQYGSLPPVPPIETVKLVKDGETLKVGPLALTAHLTPGHTPGGTSWTWQSCEQSRCLNIAYVDSLSAVSAEGYQFSKHPEVVKGFEGTFQTVSALPCDILVTPHPEASGLWDRLEKRSMSHPGACRDYANTASERLNKRIAEESSR
jgi:metallo-beta-lactamase class B